MCVEVCRQNYSCHISVLLMPKMHQILWMTARLYAIYVYTVTLYIYGNLELENRGHNGGLRS